MAQKVSLIEQAILRRRLDDFNNEIYNATADYTEEMNSIFKKYGMRAKDDGEVQKHFLSLIRFVYYNDGKLMPNDIGEAPEAVKESLLEKGINDFLKERTQND